MRTRAVGATRSGRTTTVVAQLVLVLPDGSVTFMSTVCAPGAKYWCDAASDVPAILCTTPSPHVTWRTRRVVGQKSSEIAVRLR